MTDASSETIVGVVLGAAGTIVIGVLGSVGVLYRSVNEGRRLNRAQTSDQANALIDRMRDRITALEAQEVARDLDLARMRAEHAREVSALQVEQVRLAGMLERLLGGFRIISALAADNPEMERVKLIAESFLGTES